MKLANEKFAQSRRIVRPRSKDARDSAKSRRGDRVRRRFAKGTLMTGGEIDLKHLQELLYRLIVAPTGVAEGLAHETMLHAGGPAQLIAGDDRMTPAERVEI